MQSHVARNTPHIILHTRMRPRLRLCDTTTTTDRDDRVDDHAPTTRGRRPRWLASASALVVGRRRRLNDRSTDMTANAPTLGFLKVDARAPLRGSRDRGEEEDVDHQGETEEGFVKLAARLEPGFTGTTHAYVVKVPANAREVNVMATSFAAGTRVEIDGTTGNMALRSATRGKDVVVALVDVQSGETRAKYTLTCEVDDAMSCEGEVVMKEKPKVEGAEEAHGHSHDGVPCDGTHPSHGHAHGNGEEKKQKCGHDHGDDGGECHGHDHGHGHGEKKEAHGHDHGHGHGEKKEEHSHGHGHAHGEEKKEACGHDHGHDECHGHAHGEEKKEHSHGHGHSH